MRWDMEARSEDPENYANICEKVQTKTNEAVADILN